MPAHDAEYFRLRRRAQGTPGRDPFNHPRFVQRGREMAAMMELVACPSLAWPADLYGHTVTVAELTADGDFAPAKIGRIPKHRPEDLCACGCGNLHRQNVSMTTHSAHGRGFHVMYFHRQACKSDFAQKRLRTD